MYHKNATSSNTTAADGVRYIPSGSSAGKVRSGPRSTLQVASVRGVQLVRPANTGALRRACVSVTCQPKCQMAVCGDVTGGVATLVNRIRTLVGDWSAGRPPQLVCAVLGNCRV